MVPLKLAPFRPKRKLRRRDYASQTLAQPVVMKQLAQAYHKKHRPVIISWLIRLLPLLLLILVGGVISSPIFRIRNVIINNIPFRETETRLQAALQEFFASKRAYILPRSNLIFFDAAAARTFLSRELYSANVIFERHWPNVLKVNYAPENIVAQWQNRGKIYAVDQRGIIIQELTNIKLNQTDLLVVDEVGEAEHRLGDTVASDKLIELLHKLPSAWQGNIAKYKIQRLVVNQQVLPTVHVYTPDGWYIQVSAEEDIDKQMKVLNRLLVEKIKADINRLEYIDVRFVTKATYFFKK